MQFRQLGRSSLMVSPLCLGGNVFGWTADEAASFRVLDAFFDAGFNFVDTADVYSRWVPGHVGGESEIVLGRWMKARGNRDKVILATKVGSDMGLGRVSLEPDYIARAAEASLTRLQTDYIDLYQSHRDDPETPIADTLAAYGRLVTAGKVRAIGASNFTADRLKASLETSAAHGLPRYETLQPEYNLYARAGFEDDLGPLCAAENVAVIGYYGLASGFLTGKYRSEADVGLSPRGKGVAAKYFNPRGFGILAALDTVAARHGANPAQVSMAWLIARSTSPIASATTPEQLKDFVGAVNLKLTQQDFAELDAASA